MNTSFSFDTERFRSILIENTQVLADIADRGGDLTRKVEIEFSCEFPQEAQAKAARSEMRRLAELPDGGLYIIADYSRNQGHCDLVVCVRMVPEPQIISELETCLVHVAEVCGGDFSGWEFADASN